MSRIFPSARRATSSCRKPSMISRCDADSGSPCALQVVELLLVELRDGGRVRAAHVVGLDLEARDRVGVRLLREQQVAALLERVGLLRARVHLDHAAPYGARAAAEHAAERKVGDRVRRRVLLERVEVDVLAAVRHVGARHPRASSPARRASSPSRPCRAPTRRRAPTSRASRRARRPRAGCANTHVESFSDCAPT